MSNNASEFYRSGKDAISKGFHMNIEVSKKYTRLSYALDIGLKINLQKYVWSRSDFETEQKTES